MPRFCGACARKQSDSTQPEFAQHGVTLWFKVATTEQFFARRKETNTVKNLAPMCALAAFAEVGLLVYLLTLELPSDLARDANKICIGAVLGEALMTAVGYLTSRAMARNPCLPPIATEAAVVVFLIFHALLLFPVDTWYAAKLMGEDPAEVWDGLYNFSDTRTLLALSSLVLGTHMALPIRWVVFLPLVAVSVLLYAGFAFGLGSPDGFHAWSSLMLFAALNTTGVIGRRTIETHEREALCQLISERNKRVETEFQLSQLEEQVARPEGPEGPEARGQEEDHGSVRESRPETTDSALVFEKGDVDQVLELGRKEQWYIDERELSPTPEVLGQGSFGSVVAGSFYGSPVAIKVAREPLRGSKRKSPEKLLISLFNEVRILRRLRHPNVVLFHGACKDNSSMGFSLVLERVQGLPLDKAVVEGSGEWKPLSLRDRFRAIVDTCRALCYLHSRLPTIVHGDLKASNTFAEMETGRPGLIRAKLLDFGLSRSLTRHAKPLGGSLMWMAPEVARGQSRPQTAGDVYSFGRLVYFASTRRFPKPAKDGRGAWKLLQPGGNSDLVWPVDAAGGLVQTCRPIVGTCCSYAAGTRPSMMQVSQQLEELDPEAVASGDRAEGAPGPGQGSIEGSPSPSPPAETTPAKAMTEATPAEDTLALGRTPSGNPGAGASSSALPQVMEVDRAVPNELAVPFYHATPNFTAFALVLEAAGRVNFRVPAGESSMCCLHHATLRHMVEVIEDLSRQGCKPSPFSYRKTQCPQCCLLLDMNDDDEDDADTSDEEEGSRTRADGGKAVLTCPSCGIKVEVDRQRCQ